MTRSAGYRSGELVAAAFEPGTGAEVMIRRRRERSGNTYYDLFYGGAFKQTTDTSDEAYQAARKYGVFAETHHEYVPVSGQCATCGEGPGNPAHH